MNHADKMFYRGFAAALAAVARSHGERRFTAKIAYINGLTAKSFREADTNAYDFQEFEAELEKLEKKYKK